MRWRRRAKAKPSLAEKGCCAADGHGKDLIMNDDMKKNVESEDKTVKYDEVFEVSGRKVECLILLWMLVTLILVGIAFLLGMKFGVSYGG